MGYAMKPIVLIRTDEANVAVTLIKSGRPWMGYSLFVFCRLLTCLTVVGLAVVGIIYGLR
jgi:hypothetical protein